MKKKSCKILYEKKLKPFFTVFKKGRLPRGVYFWQVFILLFFAEKPLFSQEEEKGINQTEDSADTTEVVQEKKVSVFLDCNSCDNTFIRQELNFVNYVRDPQSGQVHVFITDQSTASGARIFKLSFIGKKEFEGIENNLTYTSAPYNTKDEEREGLNRFLKLGLISYIAQTQLAGEITVEIPVEPGEAEARSEEDFWNNWMFEIYGGLNFSKETSVSALDIRYGLYADYVTETWRIRLRPYFNYNQRDIKRDNEEIQSILHRDGFEGKAVRSISDHWSIGVFTDAISNTYENIEYGYRIAPAIEYSLLPYEMALRREYTVAYTVGYLYRNYLEETIYDQLKESFYNQSLKVGVRVLQPWGSVRAGLEGSHFLRDFSKNRISLDARLSLRVFKGLSVDFSSNYDYVQDQISLPKGDASLEDVLLQQRQLATTYNFSLSVGLSYNFGSIYNNVVNTRL